MKGNVWPTSDPPMKPAIALMPARGRTYPLIRAPADVDSAAITGHSVFGVRQILLTRSTIFMG
jgi:hypothetical protein